jgi:hypothetical protein
MKVYFVLLISLIFGVVSAQQPQKSDLKLTQDLINSYMIYFKSYETLPSEVERKAKFNDIIDKENPSLSKTDRERAFKIVDSYIRADKGELLDFNLSDADKATIQNIISEAQQKEAMGMQGMQTEVNRIQNMTYSEYKAFVTQNGQIPLNESDIQKAYNKLHENDGKQIKVSKDQPQHMNYVQAMDILRNPKNYNEFSKAMRFINPSISEEDIEQAWQNR